MSVHSLLAIDSVSFMSFFAHLSSVHVLLLSRLLVNRDGINHCKNSQIPTC